MRSLAFFVNTFVGVFVMLASPKRQQRLGSMAANTLVVSERRG